MNSAARSQFAVPPGMTYRDYLPQARAAYRALLSGEAAPAARLFPPAVLDDLVSLIRGRTDPRTRPAVRPDRSGLADRRKACGLASWWPGVDRALRTAGSGRMAVALDADGVVLARTGDRQVLREAAAFGLDDGVPWAGPAPGTNGVRLAVRTGRPVQVVGPQHLKLAQQGVCCTVAPLTDRDGRVVGHIDLIAPAWEVNPEMLLLVTAAARQFSGLVDRTNRRRLAGLGRRVSGELDLERYPDGMLVVDAKGWVAHAHRWDHDERLPVPAGGFTPAGTSCTGWGRWCWNRCGLAGLSGGRCPVSARHHRASPSTSA